MFKIKCKVGDKIRLVTIPNDDGISWSPDDEGRIVIVNEIDHVGDPYFFHKGHGEERSCDQTEYLGYELVEEEFIEEEEKEHIETQNCLNALQEVHNMLVVNVERPGIQLYIEGFLAAFGKNIE